MGLIKGISYNIKGLGMSLRTPKLLLLGLVRIFVVLFFTILAAGLIIHYHQQIVDMAWSKIWSKPESLWIQWLWYVFTWLLSLVLVGLSVVLSYLMSQILFSVVIMDQMSRITEKMITGQITEPRHMSFLKQFFYLIKQEIPRAIVPVVIMLLLTIFGWLTPLGPIIIVITTAVTIVFLAWDNTDLTPARRMIPFKTRFSQMTSSLGFHVGFGLLFLVPVLNIIFLSFAPVGATLYFIDKDKF
jgi:CysZ protein